MEGDAAESPPTAPPDGGARPPFRRRVRIRNHESIGFCDVTLEPLTVSVGRNRSGKSTFLDALEPVADPGAGPRTAAEGRADGRSALPSKRRERELNDRLWELVRSLLHPPAPEPRGGRPRADDRACSEGVVLVLRNGPRWKDVPRDRFPSGPTAGPSWQDRGAAAYPSCRRRVRTA